MLIGACVCPHAPLLVPDLAPGAPEEVQLVRAATQESVGRVLRSGAERIVVVGLDDVPGEWGTHACGSIHGFGRPLVFGQPEVRTPPQLPPSLTIAAYLLGAAGWSGPVRYVAVNDSSEPADLAAHGAELVAGHTPVALIAMGDGSAKHSASAPGYFDGRATGFDQHVVTALQTLDTTQLLGLDRDLATELWVAGVGAWQVLAGAVQTLHTSPSAPRASVRYHQAPLGVGYFVVDVTVA